MKKAKYLAALSGSLLALATTSSPAAVSVAAANANGMPGGVAKPVLTIDFGTVFDLVAMDMVFEYDPAALHFLPAESQVERGAVTESFSNFLSYLSTQGMVWPMTPQVVNGKERVHYSFYTLSNPEMLHLSGKWTFTSAFSLGEQAMGDYPVNIFVDLADFQGNEIGIQTLATISAQPAVRGLTAMVPEPEVWAFWLAGLGLLALRLPRRG